MPETKMLTQGEKQLIIERHHELIDEFNKYLPDEYKLKYDQNLEQRLDDEAEVKYYRALQEIAYRQKRQKEILDKLIEKHGDIPQDRNLLARTFRSGLKTDGTDEADEYNEKLYLEYQNDPEKVFYKRYKGVLEFNPQLLLKAVDDKQKIADFYLKYQTICDDGFAYSSTISNKDANVNKALADASSGMSKVIEVLNAPRKYLEGDLLDYLAFPQLTKDQASMIVAGDSVKYMGTDSIYKEKFNKILFPTDIGDVKKEYDLYKKQGFIIGKGFFLRYSALKHDDATNKTKEIPLDDAIKQLKTNPNVTIEERSPEEIADLMRINGTYDREYLGIWLQKFSENYKQVPFEYETIKEENKGRFFERFFRTTSNEYRRFIDALGQYQDPTSPNYMNKRLLKDSAQAYFDHKTEDGISFNKIDKTGRDRLMLVSAVLKTFSDMDNNMDEINNEINNNIYGNNTQREPFLNGNEFEDDFISNKIENENEISNDIDLEI